MVSVKFADVYIRPKFSYHDPIITAYIDSASNIKTMHWWYQHDDGDEFMYIDLLFCDSIKTIFILDYYGYNFHSFEDKVEYTPDMYNDYEELELIINDIKDTIKEIYPGYKVYRYNKSLFNYLRNTVICHHKKQISALPQLLSDIEKVLLNKIAPKWTQYKHMPIRNRWKVQKATSRSYAQTVKLYYNDWKNLDEIKRKSINTRTKIINYMSHIVINT